MPVNPPKPEPKSTSAKKTFEAHQAVLAVALGIAAFGLAAAGLLIPGLLCAVAAGAIANE